MNRLLKKEVWWPLVFWLALSAVVQAGERLHSVSIENPRSYGYHAGDTASQTLHIKYAADMELRMDGAPKPGNVTPWIKLERIGVDTSESGDAKHSKITLSYQISGFDPEEHAIETPEFTLTVEKNREKIPVVIHSVELHISRLSADIGDTALENITLAAPLGPDMISDRLYTYAKWLMLVTGLALLVWAAFKIISSAANWNAEYPFSAALKKIRQMPPDASDGELEARRVLHSAFNQQFGRTLFESNLDQFFNEHPVFQKEESVIRNFYEDSTSLFFAKDTTGETDNENTSLAQLSNLAKRCRSFEKGPVS